MRVPFACRKGGLCQMVKLGLLYVCGREFESSLMVHEKVVCVCVCVCVCEHVVVYCVSCVCIWVCMCMRVNVYGFL